MSFGEDLEPVRLPELSTYFWRDDALYGDDEGGEVEVEPDGFGVERGEEVAAVLLERAAVPAETEAAQRLRHLQQRGHKGQFVIDEELAAQVEVACCVQQAVRHPVIAH